MSNKPPLRAVRVENFKAIRDSGNQQLGWITAFIGNNGVGKSSLFEALETFQDCVINGIDDAFHRWRGFENVLNRSHKRKLMTRKDDLRRSHSQPMVFRCDWGRLGSNFGFMQKIATGEGKNEVFIDEETIITKRKNRQERWSRDSNGRVFLDAKRFQPDGALSRQCA